MGFKKVGKPIRSGRLQNSNSRKMRRGGGTRSGNQNTGPINPETGFPFQIGDTVVVKAWDPYDTNPGTGCPSCGVKASYQGDIFPPWDDWGLWNCSCECGCATDLPDAGCSADPGSAQCEGNSGACCSCGQPEGWCPTISRVPGSWST